MLHQCDQYGESRSCRGGISSRKAIHSRAISAARREEKVRTSESFPPSSSSTAGTITGSDGTRNMCSARCLDAVEYLMARDASSGIENRKSDGGRGEGRGGGGEAWGGV